MARWKARVEFLLSVIGLVFLSLTVEALQGKRCQESLLSGGGRSVRAKISGEGVVPGEYFFGFYKTRHILLSDSAHCTVLNAAVRVVSGTHKFDRGLTHLLHSELHWLDVPQCIQFKLGVTVHRCLRGNAPQYLVDCCKSTTDAVSRQRLRSASRRQLIVPRHRRTIFGRLAFTVVGPTAWNSLPDYLRDPPLSEDTFRRLLKAYLFALY